MARRLLWGNHRQHKGNCYLVLSDLKTGNVVLNREPSNGESGNGDSGFDSQTGLTPHQQHQQYLGEHRPELDPFPELDWEGQLGKLYIIFFIKVNNTLGLISLLSTYVHLLYSSCRRCCLYQWRYHWLYSSLQRTLWSMIRCILNSIVWWFFPGHSGCSR